MATLNIVLVEPEVPPNTGNIGRTCACTGAALHLIHPLGFDTSDKSVRRAGMDYWQHIEVFHYDSLDDFFQKNQGNFYYFSTKAKYKYTDISYPDNAYLFFGKESAGLPEDLLHNNPETTVRIPMEGSCRSLNLSNAASIATYEVLRQWGFPELLSVGSLTKYNWD